MIGPFSPLEPDSQESVSPNALVRRPVQRNRNGWKGPVLLFVLAVIVVLSLCRLLIGSHNWATVFWITLGYLLYELLLNLYLALNSFWAVMARNDRVTVTSPLGTSPPVSVVIAACNEEKAILPTLDAVFQQEGVDVEVFVVSNGSIDETVRTVRERYGLGAEGFREGVWKGEIDGKRLTLADLPERGKAAALNWGLRESNHPVFVSLDADTHLRPGALAALSRAFANEEVMAAGGFLHVRDPEKAGWLVRFQFVEYLKAFIWRIGFAEARICLQVSGAFGGFRRSELVKLGGFDETSLVEDYEIIYRMHEYYRGLGAPYLIDVVPEALADTETPHQVGEFVKQRTRWFCGFLQTLWSYRGMILEPKYGAIGLWMLPIKCVDAILPLWGISALTIFLFVLAFGHQTIQLVAMQMFCTKYVIEFFLAVGVIGLERWVTRERFSSSSSFSSSKYSPGTQPPVERRNRAGNGRFWQLLCLLLDGLTFDWFRQFAVARAYLEFVRRIRRWEPSKRRTVAEAMRG